MIKKFFSGVMGNNTYLIEDNSRVVIIDPSFGSKKIVKYLQENNYSLKAIILTHGHFDHFVGCKDLVQFQNCPVYLPKEDEYLAHNQQLLQAKQYNLDIDTVDLCVGDLIIGNIALSIIATSGHSEGSVCILYNNVLFTGDTLFHKSVGRTDLYSGNSNKLNESLRVIASLDENLLIYPGHDEESTLKDELVSNPYLKNCY
ncbi:MAG: MBL fold metallo-hydrolase [Erysipelotrichaceae bacterium]